MSLVLSLFPGIGLLDRAFEEEGFCVVRGPDLLWGGDIRNFYPPAGVFDGVIGGPPCQAFSQMRNINPLAGTKHGNLIPEFERCVGEARPMWFVMENVKAAPVPIVPSYGVHEQLLKDVWVGGATMRLRRISFGVSFGVGGRRILDTEQMALHTVEPAPSAAASGGVKPGLPKDQALRGKYLGWKTSAALAEMVRNQGLPDDFLNEAPFTVTGKCRAVGNGVPLPMGRAIARAVKQAIQEDAP